MRNNDDAIPTVQDNTLIYQKGGQIRRLSVGTQDWYAWLDKARTFTFQSTFGTFTARKERASNKRGGWYWRAYRKREGALRRVYLGKSEKVTLIRLNKAATTLAGQNAGDRDQRERQGQPEDTRVREPLPPSASRTSWSPAEHGEASKSSVRRCAPFPLPLTSFIGRKEEVAAASALFSNPEVRLLTLTGPGEAACTFCKQID